MLFVGVVVATLSPVRLAVADNDVSSSTSSYFSTNGSLGVPVFGTFATVDNGLRPVAAYALEVPSDFLPAVAQFLVDDSRKAALTGGETLPSFERLATTDIGIRLSGHGFAASGSTKEGYLVSDCGYDETHPLGPYLAVRPLEGDCAGDPRAALTHSWSWSVGGRLTLSPSHLIHGLAAEGIITESTRPFLAYAALTARREYRETTDVPLDSMHEYGVNVGVSLRVYSRPWGGGTYGEVGLVGRVLRFQPSDGPYRAILSEAALTAQVRVWYSFDLLVRAGWERLDTIDVNVSTVKVGWIWALQPTIFF